MRKISLTLFAIAAVSCAEPPRQAVKFQTSSAGDGVARLVAPGRAFLVGLDDPEFRPQFDQMAVAGNFLYFNIPWYGVYRMPKYGGEVDPIEEAKGVESFEGVAANGTDVYWVRLSNFGSAGPDFPRSRLRRQALSGGPLQTVAEGDIWIGNEWYAGGRAFHAGAEAVYGAVQYPQKDYADLTRFPVEGGASTVLWHTEFDLDAGLPPYVDSDLVFDEAFTYVSSCDNSPGTTNCVLERIDLISGARDTLAATESQHVVAVDATDLYLVTPLQLVRRSKDGGGEAAVLATFGANQWATRMAVVDDENVYLIANRGALVAIPKVGGTPRTLATGFEQANMLVQDEQNIFVMYDYRAIDIVPKSSTVATP